jgi:phytoene/squalene synthetase
MGFWKNLFKTKRQSRFLDSQFLQNHLDETSRSFAFCIQVLPPPFKQWIALSYLLCRILDTIEDYPWPNEDIKAQQFDLFKKFLLQPTPTAEIESWIQNFSQTIPQNYLKLVQDSNRLFQGLHQEVQPDARRICQNCILKMEEGMKHYSALSQANSLQPNSLQLKDLGDVNRYCYFVAGIVGELIRKLYCHYKSTPDSDTEFKTNSIHFGLYLQKINLLKDKSVDESEGRFLVPDRGVLLASLIENARGALNFLLRIPIEEKGFRLFCGWSLFLGLATIQVLELNEGAKKLGRLQALALIEKVENLIQDNPQIEKLFQTYSQVLNQRLTADLPISATNAWFLNTVEGLLTQKEMKSLKL